MGETGCGCAIAIIILLIILGIEFLAVAGLVWLVCWAFGLTFTMKAAVGIWAIVMILTLIFGGRNVSTD